MNGGGEKVCSKNQRKVTRVWGRRGFVFVFVLMGPMVVASSSSSCPKTSLWGGGGDGYGSFLSSPTYYGVPSSSWRHLPLVSGKQYPRYGQEGTRMMFTDGTLVWQWSLPNGRWSVLESEGGILVPHHHQPEAASSLTTKVLERCFEWASWRSSLCCTYYYVIPAAPTSHPPDHLPLPLPGGYVRQVGQ